MTNTNTNNKKEIVNLSTITRCLFNKDDSIRVRFRVKMNKYGRLYSYMENGYYGGTLNCPSNGELAIQYINKECTDGSNQIIVNEFTFVNLRKGLNDFMNILRTGEVFYIDNTDMVNINRDAKNAAIVIGNIGKRTVSNKVSNTEEDTEKTKSYKVENCAIKIEPAIITIEDKSVAGVSIYINNKDNHAVLTLDEFYSLYNTLAFINFTSETHVLLTTYLIMLRERDMELRQTYMNMKENKKSNEELSNVKETINGCEEKMDTIKEELEERYKEMDLISK